ncbi:MAG: hypothetical protein CML03_00400 [Pseudooceanicola sp.]|jgi:uncharacterized protein YdaU (DUF1376 family)|nr:hypothetical protein [Pseudooceanicola sp.]|tara:strand:+ start:993 stop:1766 length:774 start_codon:yes stop_codon:yes gene_type:complete
MTDLPFMQWSPKDYKADTSHLDLEEDGFYRRLLDELWLAEGRLAFDVKRLSRRLRIHPNKFNKLWAIVGDFFIMSEGQITHKRIDKDRTRVQILVEKRREAGKAGGEASAKKRKKSKAPSQANVKQTYKQTSTKPEPEGSGRTLTGSTMNLSPDGALALDRLRAAVGDNLHQRNELSKFEHSLTEWDGSEGRFIVASRWVRDHFMERLRVPLRECNLVIACVEQAKAEPREVKRPAVVIPLPSARKINTTEAERQGA